MWNQRRVTKAQLIHRLPQQTALSLRSGRDGVVNALVASPDVVLGGGASPKEVPHAGSTTS